LRAQRSDFGEEHGVQHLAQVAHATCAAGDALEADHALYRGDMLKAPQAKGVLQIGEFFAQLLQAPMVLGIAVERRTATAFRKPLA
jgi:hypothetical protein